MSRVTNTRGSKKRSDGCHDIIVGTVESDANPAEMGSGSGELVASAKAQRRVKPKQNSVTTLSGESQPHPCPPPPCNNVPVLPCHQALVPAASAASSVALQVQQCNPNVASPLNAQLLSCFGGFTAAHKLNVLEHFFKVSLKYSREEVVEGLVTLSNGMVAAIDVHNRVKNDLVAVNSRAERIFMAEQASERLCADLRQERDNLQVSLVELQKENKSLCDQLTAARTSLESKSADNTKIADLLKKNQREVEELKEKLRIFGESKETEMKHLKQDFDQQKVNLDLRIQLLEAEVLENRNGCERLASLISNFTDPVTLEQHQCPVIQTNGVVRSLSGIIDVWLKESNMGQSNAFRMFQCPVLRNFTMIAPFPIVDSFMKFAESLKMDVSPPVSFHFKTSDDSWVEFSFHEQLELIARLCDVYNQRANATRPPEQRNVSVGGMSFLISMHAIVHGQSFRLECFGINNNGSGKVEIKVNFRAGWTHPFVDMEFPAGF